CAPCATRSGNIAPTASTSPCITSSARGTDLTVRPGLATLRASPCPDRAPMSNAPHFEIDVASFWADPYPTLARMRKDAPIAFVPQLGSTVFTRRDDIFTQEKRIDVFSSHQPAG